MKIGNNFKPAIAFTVLPFVLRRFFPPEAGESIMLIFFGAAILCITVPAIGEFIHDILSRLGSFLGRQLAKIILFLVWIFAVLPLGCLMKITGRDRLRLKKQDVKSYWIDNKVKNTDYEYQF